MWTPGWSADPEPKGKDEPKGKPTNRLAREISPYLLQHAHNPVDWYPWGPEAFARAKKENKLIFLSIGYSSCHWCHVMERESFANEAIAKILNQDFVCIKVDREERPDIDHIYMTALMVRSKSGGWPMTMFLLPDGKPIVGGTYYPPEDRKVEGGTVRGLKTILGIMKKAHAETPKDLVEVADETSKMTLDALTGPDLGTPLIKLERDLVDGAVERMKERFDPVHGGFGSPAEKFEGTKFPTPPCLLLLQSEAERTKAKDLQDILTLTLDKMAQGGIYDHLGGGFHRYSTERTWTVPHFEKMLYDNAQLLEVYARALKHGGAPRYRRVLQQTLDFLDREMTSPEGAYYSALDADSSGEEGRFYVWTEDELGAVLKDKEEAKLIRSVYGAAGAVNFEEKYHILTLPLPLAEQARDRKLTEQQLEDRLVPVRQKLFQVRARRTRPFLDTKVLTAWNGEMIAGVAAAGAALEDKKVVERAKRAADFVLKNLRTPEGRLLRTYGAAPGQKAESRLNGYLDDYAFLVHGLLGLHDATGEARWLDEARKLTDTMVKFHGDEAGGFFYTSSDHEKLFARSKDQYDGAQPSGNSLAARSLVRLWIKTADERYAKLAEKTFRALALSLKTSPGSHTAMADALGIYLEARKK
jgi:uncharacterized protein YyaL (SSP411 family)